MLEGGGGGDLLNEAVGAEHRGQFRPEHLEGNVAFVLEILGEVNRGHSALADLALDPVPVGQRGREAFGP